MSDDGLYGDFGTDDLDGGHGLEDHTDPADGADQSDYDGQFTSAYDSDSGGVDDHLSADAAYDGTYASATDPYVSDGDTGVFTDADGGASGAASADDGHDGLGGFQIDDTTTPVGALTDLPYEVDSGADDFPPQLNLGIDTPADGGPWLDLSLLGDDSGGPGGGGSDTLSDDGSASYALDLPQSPAGALADLTAADAGTPGATWTDLATSDDPAVRSLATFWSPAA